MAADQVLKRFARQIRKEDAAKEPAETTASSEFGIAAEGVHKECLRQAHL